MTSLPGSNSPDRTSASKALRVWCATSAVLVSAVSFAWAQGPQPLTQLQFDIVGVRLVVDPPALTVPKQIATQINTSLQLPAGAGSATADAVAAIAQGALVEGTLRGPSLPATRITARPGQPLLLPPFALPGDYFLDGVRLVKDGEALLDATTADGRPATTIPIAVINEILVTSVTSRPLSIDEIREKGIIIDQTNFQTVNFQVAFNIDGSPFTIQMPVALPSPQLINSRSSNREQIIEQLRVVNQQLATLQTTLPAQFDRPGLNFSIAPLPFFPVLEDAADRAFEIPPITGLIVIPGNVAFLNQFFSVVLMVSNAAPDGTPLVLRDVTGTVKLPAGLDRVPGASYEQPGDDPLRLARIEGAGQQPTVRVAQNGPDGEPGTADDILIIPAQMSGEGEFLIEGLKEGGHLFDIEIDAVLDGLPSGPVSLVGQAAGSVFVRNPTFAVTLSHPRTVRSGEPYDVYATVTNTSRSVANLVSINLDPLGISGAQLVSGPTVSFDTLPAGQAATARFRLIAQRTGDVTASSFTGQADGGIRLVTGVDERGAPLAPNAIVLPATAGALPDALVSAAQRVLGQAFSIATAPAEALPPGVLFVKRQTVIDRGLELAEAGQRLQFGDTVPRAIRDLLLDWLGARVQDDGFDQIMRETEAGRAFLSEIGAVLAPQLTSDPIAAQRMLVEQALARAAPLSAVARGPADRAPVVLHVTRDDGAAAGPAGVTLPFTGLVPAEDDGGGRATLAAVVAPTATRYTIEALSPEGGAVDLGVAFPATNPLEAQQLAFTGVSLAAGGVIRVIVDLASPGVVLAEVDENGDGVVDRTLTGAPVTLAPEPFGVVDVIQLQSSFFEAPGNIRDPATYGLLVGVLFNKPVTRSSVELKSNYQVEANTVVGAAQQAGGRLVYLYLERPVGGLTPRSLTLADVLDVNGHTLPSTTRPIRMVLTDGARVFGQVREATGSGVPNGFLSLVVSHGITFSFTVSTIHTDAQGTFDFDFVPRIGTTELTAQHPQTLAIASLSARIRGAGESLLLNPTFLGAGTVRGRVLAIDGATPVPNAIVALIPGSPTASGSFAARSDAVGAFTFTGVPVGVFSLRAIDGVSASGQSTGVLETAGGVATADVVIAGDPSTSGRLVGRVFLSDGTTPASNFTVFVGSYDRGSGQVRALDRTTTDASGSFAFASLLPAGGYDVVAVDQATGQIGSTRASVAALTTTAVSIVLEATGAIEGVVFNASAQPVAGAIVAGGVALVYTDANGRFRIEGVPAGPRTIEAGDPVTRRRGSASVVVLPGQTVTAAITLEARATITGRVLDASGNPVPRASVRLPSLGGFTFVIANNQGVYTFPDMPLGDYLIQAPGPSAESLIEYLAYYGYDPSVAFTSGDGPVGPAPPSSSDTNAVLAAYRNAVQSFVRVDESLLGLPDADLGGFGWNRVRLFQDQVTAVADVRFLQLGTVSGRTVTGQGQPTGALVRVSGLKVGSAGNPIFGELARLTSDAATGEFTFGGIARFDQATFQAAGVRAGDFSLEAASQFSPAIVQFRDQLNTANPDRSNIVLQFPAAAETNGTASGVVLMPDGVTPAPAGTTVAISFGDLTVTTDAQGRFASLLPIPAGSYTFTARTPSGLQAQAQAFVPAGGAVQATLRLLGLGSLVVQARRPDGQIVAGASLRVRRGSFPQDAADGVTDATGARRFVNLSEGPFSVEVEEAGTGLRGRASGVIVRDAEVTSVVTITASGRVTGTFVTANGNQPIPFAQVTINAGGVQAYTTTDGLGRFALLAIPVGTFTVEASDPASGRIGRAQGQLAFEGQTVDVTVIQVPRGTIAGYVLNADGVTGVGGANVRVSSTSAVAVSLQVTTRQDGSFRIEGVSAGAFRLESRDPVSGAEGSATGTMSFEGEIVDRNIVLEPFGAIRVTVLSETGQPASNARVTVAGRDAAVDLDGRFTFENVRLGTYSVGAVSLADALNGGIASAVLDEANETVDVTVSLRGVAPVTVRVVASDGASPVASARVTLNARGAFAGEPGGPTATSMVGFTDGAGLVTFASVPLGDYFVTGESGALAGVATGSTPGVGQSSLVTVTLGASGSISGRLLLPDGTTPAFRALVTLNFQSQSGLQSGVLQITTDLTGRFSFAGIPLGGFTMSGFEVVSNGVRSVAGSLTTGGQLLDLGDVALDNTGPRVVSVTPSDGVTGVSPSSPIVLTFSEPMLASSVSSTAIGVLAGTTAVTGSVSLSADRRVATFTPAQPLASNALYTITVKGAPDGPRDESNIGMVDPFVSTFRVRDSIPPVVVSVFPAADARGVVPEAAVRVTFSEPVVSAALVLRTAAGAVVPAQTSLAAGGTAVVLSPVDFLPANVTFTATLTSAFDTAGNALAGAPVSFTFHTVDTIAPLVTALGVQGVARAGATLTLTPSLSGDDIARVEYVAGAATRVSTTAPFATTIPVPDGASSFEVLVRAVDLTGNRSEAFTRTIVVEANQAPSLQLVNVSGDTVAPQGATLAFDVVASDDVGIGRILLSSVGAVRASFDQAIAGAPTSTTQRFSIDVPAGATPGAVFTIQAAVIDTAGQTSAPATLALSIRDGVAPLVTITAPDASVRAVPGQPLTVTVTASDSGGIATVTLVCNPALAGCEARPIAPPLTSTTQTFTVDVPVSLNAPATITILATAADAAGNVGQAGRVVPVADVITPVLASLQTVSGSTNVMAGAQALMQSNATDNVAVVAIDFETEGAVTTNGTVPVVPAVTPASVQFGIAIPATAPTGGTVTVRARARDAAGNLSAPATLLLTIGDVAPPAAAIAQPQNGAVYTPGQSIGVETSATDDVGVASIVLSVRGAVTFDETRTISPAVTPATASFTVPIALDAPAGPVTVTVRAVDAAGNVSADVVRTVTVRDAAGPAVTVTSPTAGAEIDPRAPLPVTVQATDAVGVAEVGLTTSGLVVSSTTRAISPAQPAATETFTVTFTELPAAGGSLTLTGTARDGAGNQAASAPVTIAVRDVVAPVVANVTPASGATGVDTAAAVVLVFAEPMDRATLTSASVRLAAGGTPVAAAVLVAPDDRTVTLTPASALAINTLYTITVDPAVRDRAANPMSAAFVSTFRTVSPDSTSPGVVSTDPAAGAVGVGTTAPVSVTFTEPVNPASLTPESFRISVDGTPVAGIYTTADGGTIGRFTPASPLPFDTIVLVQLTAGITDASGNPLVNGDGSAITTPISWTYLTGQFAIVAPAGTTVLENTGVTLEASAASSLAPASVVFTVNGVEQAPVTSAPFTRSITTPSASASSTLTVVASARNASNVEIARAERSYDVLAKLSATPGILGVPRGGSRRVRLSLATPLTTDLSIAVSTVDPTVATAGTAGVVLPAGQTSVDVMVTACATCPGDPAIPGKALGNTALVATSSRGVAVATISVSDPVAGQTLTPFASAVGLAITPAPSSGRIVASAAQQVSTQLVLLSQPATETTTVSVTSSNPSVATATASAIGSGQQSTTLSIVTGADGTAVLTVRAGNEVRTLTVIVGTPSADQIPVTFAPAVGLIVQPLSSAGRLYAGESQARNAGVRVLGAPHNGAAPLAVSVTSSNPAVATATGTAIQPGQQSTTLAMTTGVAGTATLTITAGTTVTSVSVVVGAPPADLMPMGFAPAVGLIVQPMSSAGRLYAGESQARNAGVRVLGAPHNGATPLAVSVTSSNPAVATATGTAIEPGQQVTTLAVTTGVAGTATLTITAGTTLTTVSVVVGTPPADLMPMGFAPAVGLIVVPDRNAGAGRVIASPGAPVSASIGVRLLTAPLAGNVMVTVSTSNPAVVGFGASTSMVIPLDAGQVVVPVTFVTTGVTGSAVLTFEIDGVRRELLVVVGNPPASELPAVLAPVVGVQVP